MCLKVVGGGDERWPARGGAHHWAASTGVRRIANHNPRPSLQSSLTLRLGTCSQHFQVTIGPSPLQLFFLGGSRRQVLPLMATVLRMRCGEDSACQHSQLCTGMMGAGIWGIGA